MSWIKETFSAGPPVIGMLHLKALPGDPGYDPNGTVASVVDHARRDLVALQRGGVDAILISNEFSLPYLTRTEPITAITMARIIGELLTEMDRPFGVNVLWDAKASVDLAAATGAAFAREIFTGVYSSDFGLWNTNIGEVARHHARVDRRRTRLLYNVVPEAASYLGTRNIADIAKSTVFNTRPDALCVSGLTAGAPTDSSTLKAVKDAVPDTAVFVNTGVRETNVREQLAIADGAIVGTFFKKDGAFENPVDEDRVRRLMDIVEEFRSDS